ncbi:MAG TPA: ABC transporter permease [Blastocatellia bacterium]|nr:ABC transporter permease [Blastocatellia bacterium]
MQDLRYALRMLLNKPGFTLVAVVTLALGIGANTAIFSAVNSVLLSPLPYPESDRLFSVMEHDKDGPNSTSGYATIADWGARSESFEQIAAVRSWNPTLTGEGEPERLSAMRVSSGFFDLLGFKPVLGRGFLPEDDRPDSWQKVILSYGLWQRRFESDPNIIGKPVVMNGNTFAVVGVMPQGFQELISLNFYTQAELWAPLGYDQSLPYACRTCRHLRAIARIKPGVPVEQAQAELKAISASMAQDNPRDYSSAEVSLVRLQDRFTGEIRPALLLLLGAVGFVLLIACSNLANLLLVRATGRQKEMAVRAAIGASRARLVRQTLTESLLLAFIGAGAGLLVALWGVELLIAFNSDDKLRLTAIAIDGRVLAFTLGVSVVAGLSFGLAPAIRNSRIDLNSVLKQGGRSSISGADRHFRSLLVVAEIAMALVLLIGAGLMLKSFVRLLEVDPGFDTRNLLTLSTSALGNRYEDDSQVLAFQNEVLARVKAVPGVESVGLVSDLPLRGDFDQTGLHVEERPLANPSDAPSPQRYVISLDYLEAMRIPLLQGRSFTETDGPGAPLVVLINRTLAERFWPSGDPLGKRVRLGGPDDPWRTIVGVVGDIRHMGLDAPEEMQVYAPQAQGPFPFMFLVVRSSVDPASLIGSVQREVWAVDKDQPVYNVATMEQLVSRSVAQRQFTMSILGIFASVALIMAAVGIYGLISYSVSQRTHEIGLRIALGAQPGDVLRMVIGQGMALAVAGLVSGLAVSFLLTRLLTNLLYGVSVTDPAIFALTSLALAGVALAACYVPARRATKVEPMEALRYE